MVFWIGFEKRATKGSTAKSLAKGILNTKSLDREGIAYGLGQTARMSAGTAVPLVAYSKYQKEEARRQRLRDRRLKRQLKKKAEALRKEVATVAIIHDGKILMGKRRDNEKYTVPGGHLDPGEDPETGALREVKEESGIDLDRVDFKGSFRADNGYTIHCFVGHLKESNGTSMKEDPDGEVYRWHWMTIPPKLHVLKKLHVPLEKNCLMKVIGVTEEQEGYEKVASPVKVIRPGRFITKEDLRSFGKTASKFRPIVAMSDDFYRQYLRSQRRGDKDRSQTASG